MATWLRALALGSVLVSASADKLADLLDTQATRCQNSKGSTEATKLVSTNYYRDAAGRSDPNLGLYTLANVSDAPVNVTNGCPIFFGMMHDEIIYVNMVRESAETDLFIQWNHENWYALPYIHFKNGGGRQSLYNIRIQGQDVWTLKTRGWFFEEDGVNHVGEHDPFEVQITTGYEGNDNVRYEGHWTFTFYDQSREMREDQYNALKLLFDSTCKDHRNNGGNEALPLDFDYSNWLATSTGHPDDLPVCLWMGNGWNHTAFAANNFNEACSLMDFVECIDGYVTHIFLGFEGLRGPIPAGLSALSELREIYLEWNSLTGGLPDMFKDHVHLKEVSLYNNQLSGPLPDFSGDANLGILWLEQNKFTGTVPSSFGTLTNLGSLWFDHNEITGTIPDLSGLTKLTRLFMGTNHMTGTIPSTLCTMVALDALEMAYNRFHGGWPQACINPTDNMGWKRLYYLDVAHNRFSGTIPKFGDGMIQLVRIDFSYNSYEGSVTDQFNVVLHNAIEHSDWYTELYATGNKLSGPFPEFAYNMTYNAQRVDRFSITDNLFRCENTGRLPTWTVRASFAEHGTCVPVPNPKEIVPSTGLPGTIVVVIADEIVPTAQPTCKFYKAGTTVAAIAAGSVLFDASNPAIAPKVRCHVPAALGSSETETYSVTVANFGEDFASTEYWQGAPGGIAYNPPSFEVTALEILSMDQGYVVTTSVTLVGVTAATFNEPAFRQMIADLTGLPETSIVLYVGGRSGTRRMMSRVLRFRQLQQTLDVDVDVNLPSADLESTETLAEVDRVKAVLADSSQVEDAMARFGFQPESAALEVVEEPVALEGTVLRSSTTTTESNMGLGIAIAAVGICLVCCCGGFVVFLRYREKKGSPYFQETLDESAGGGNYSGATYGNTA